MNIYKYINLVRMCVENREGAQRIRERLDRAIGNLDLIGKYPTLRVTHKLIGSDHCPLIIELNPKRGGWKKKVSL